MTLDAADRKDLMHQALRRPQVLPEFSLSDWDVLIRQARRSGLLARIGCVLEAQGSIETVPSAPRAHLKAAVALGEAQHAEAMRELASIDQALAPTGVRPVLLKGAAYVAAGLLPAMGRMFTDIDILVPKSRLAEVEAALMSQGWATTHHSPYDQRYYRQWMHELPPLRHIRRGTVIDVHHAILPETARLKPSSAKLLAAARPLTEPPRFSVLCATDMVLHSMVHLFHNDDQSHGLRDLSDLDLLLRHLGSSPGFWVELVERARELDLMRPLFYGLRYTSMLLSTPVPASAIVAVGADGPNRFVVSLSDPLWVRALRPRHASAADAWTPLVLLALQARAHWLRMPPAMLLRHLTVKALRLHQPASANA
jgi:putative nucleotidyltransferase-like protein